MTESKSFVGHVRGHRPLAVQDGSARRLAAEHGVTFDVCPISNVRLKVVPDLAAHPIRRLMQAGIRCTVSTDDPLCFGNKVVDEYTALADGLGFTKAELAQTARNGWEVADVSPATRRAALDEIQRLASAR